MMLSSTSPRSTHTPKARRERCACRRNQGKEAISRWRTLKGQLRNATSDPPRAGTIGSAEAATRQGSGSRQASPGLEPVAEDQFSDSAGLADEIGPAVDSIDSKSLDILEKAVSLCRCQQLNAFLWRVATGCPA